jgi:signal transduction histidine kinase
MIISTSCSVVAGSVSWFKVSDGLPERIVYSSIFDKYKTLWISTQRGIYAYTGSKFIKLESLLDKKSVLEGTDFVLIANLNGFFTIKSTLGFYAVEPSLSIEGKFTIRKLLSFDSKNIYMWFPTQSNLFLWTPDSFYCFNSYLGKMNSFKAIPGEIHKTLNGELMISSPSLLARVRYTGIDTLYYNSSIKDNNLKFFTKTNFVKEFSYLDKTIWKEQDSRVNDIDNYLNELQIETKFESPISNEIYSYNLTNPELVVLTSANGIIFIRPNSSKIFQSKLNYSSRTIILDSISNSFASVYYHGFQTYDLTNGKFKTDESDYSYYNQGIYNSNTAIFTEEGPLGNILLYDFRSKKTQKFNSDLPHGINGISNYNGDTILIANVNRLYKLIVKQNGISYKKALGFKFNGIIKKVICSKSKNYLVVGTSEGLYFVDLIKNTNKLLFKSAIRSICHYKNKAIVLTINQELFVVNEDGTFLKTPIDLNNICKNSYEIIWNKASNSFWVGTDNGMFLFDNKLSKCILKLNNTDGFKSNEFNTYAFTSYKKQIFCGGLNGINWFNPSVYLKSQSIHPLFLEKQNNLSEEDCYYLNLLSGVLEFEPNENNFKVYLRYYGEGLPAVNVYNLSSKLDTLLSFNLMLAFNNLSPNNYLYKINQNFQNNEYVNFELPILIKNPWFVRWNYLVLWIFIVSLLLFLIVYLKLKITENKYINNLEVNRQQMYQIIAHDLRAPINNYTHMLGAVEFLVRNNRTEDLQKISKDLIKSSRNVDLILSNLMNLTSNKTYGINADKIKINIKQVFFQICETYELIAETKGILFSYSFDGEESVFCNEELFSLLMRNLIDNAIKHSSFKTNISLKVNKSGNRILIIQKNDFAPQHLENLQKIKAFFNTKKVIQSGEIGKGLGLTLITKSIDKLNGIIRLNLENEEMVIKILL